MRTLALVVVATALALIASPLVAGATWPLREVESIYVSRGETRCGDFFVLTKGREGARIMFEYALGGQNLLKVIALENATLRAGSDGIAPSVNVTTDEETGEILSAEFTVQPTDMDTIAACFPPPAKVVR